MRGQPCLQEHVGGSAVVDPLMAIVYAIAELLSLAWREILGLARGEPRGRWVQLRSSSRGAENLQLAPSNNIAADRNASRHFPDIGVIAGPVSCPVSTSWPVFY